MKISQPKTARLINTARVLSLLRKSSSLSKAEISRILELNKVSVGEIVDDLVSQGLVRESGKIESATGRRPTSLEIIPTSKYVLAVDIGRKNITTALCDLGGQTVRIERVPLKITSTVEEFVVGLLKSAVRTVKLVEEDRLLGVGITLDAQISNDNKTVISSPFLPWKNIELGQAFEQALKTKAVVVNSIVSLVGAEKTVSDVFDKNAKALYLNWGSSIGLGIVSLGKVVVSTDTFGQIKVSSSNSVSDGSLDSLSSTRAFTNDPEARLFDVLDRVSEESLSYIAKALRTAEKVTGISFVVIGGEASALLPKHILYLQNACPAMDITLSGLGQKAEVKAACESALDNFFYLTGMLEEMKAYL